MVLVVALINSLLAIITTGWAKKPGLILRVDNFAMASGRKVCDMSKFSEFCLKI